MYVKNKDGEYVIDENYLRSQSDAFLDHAKNDLGLTLDQIIWYEENRRNLRYLHEWVNYNYILSYLIENKREFR
jgi:hypothetical protein